MTWKDMVVDRQQDCRLKKKKKSETDFWEVTKSLSELAIKFVKNVLGNFLLQPSIGCSTASATNRQEKQELVFSVLAFPGVRKIVQMQMLRK